MIKQNDFIEWLGMYKSEAAFVVTLIVLLVIGLFLLKTIGTRYPQSTGQTETPLEKRPLVWRCLDARDADVRAIARMAAMGIDQQLLDEYNKRSHDLLLECRDNMGKWN